MKYSKDNGWYSIPTQTLGVLDVFVITPTFVFDPARPVYVAVDDPDFLAGNAEFAKIATEPVFGELPVNIWVPKYRQVNGGHFGVPAHPSLLFWDQQPKTVTQDIFQAFTFFLENRLGNGKFIIFSHSQGSILNGYLLTAYLPHVLSAAQQKELVADYLIGWGLNDLILSRSVYPASNTPTDIGTIISWNTATRSEVQAHYRGTWGDASTRAVNPITFDTRSDYVPASQNGRSVLSFFDAEPGYAERLTGARLLTPSDSGGVFGGQIVEVDIDEQSFRTPESIAGQDAVNLGYTHHWDISLFADSIRNNIQRRLL